jgi:uncharacterized membrane protein YozB (DUF420 family)
MSTIAISATKKSHTNWPRLVILGCLLALALTFVVRYAVRYYLHYDQASFIDTAQAGKPNYWILRGWLLLHISGAMIALLTGPFQFWTGFRARHMRLHRWTGRLFLLGIALGATGSVRLAFSSSFGWAFGFAMVALSIAWVTTGSMAYYAIRKGSVQIHKEWTVRAYVVTFAFVNIRLLNEIPQLKQLQPETDRGITLSWAAWVLPLLIAEVILQLRRIHLTIPSR